MLPILGPGRYHWPREVAPRCSYYTALSPGMAAAAEQKCDAIFYGRAIGAREAGSDLHIYTNSKNARSRLPREVASRVNFTIGDMTSSRKLDLIVAPYFAINHLMHRDAVMAWPLRRISRPRSPSDGTCSRRFLRTRGIRLPASFPADHQSVSNAEG